MKRKAEKKGIENLNINRVIYSLSSASNTLLVKI